MRTLLLWLVVGLVALGTILVACGGDEEQQGQQTQEQTEQTQQTDQSAAGATAERPATARQQAQESDAQQVTQETEAEALTDEPDEAQAEEPLLAEARAAFEAWTADLESFETETDVDLNLGGLSTQISTTVAVRLEPFMALATIDASSLFEIAAELAEDEQAAPEEPLLMQVLIAEDLAYLSMPQVGGWIDLSDQFDEALTGLTAMLGTNPDNLTDPNQFGQAFACIDALGGSIAAGQHDGEPVWFVECIVVVDEVSNAAAQQLREQGIDLTDAGIESMRLRMAISQTSGAPVLVESHAALRDAFGLGDAASDDGDEEQPGFYVSTVSSLVSWNEPIEFPAPEPLVDGSLFDAFSEPGSDAADGYTAGQDPPELLTTEELLALATTWAADSDELHVEFVAQAVIDGEARLASTIVRGSRIVGAFETTVNIDDASTFRLLWNRDGIWTSDFEENGEAVWAPSNPALLGFAGMTVDEFLANPDRLNLEPLQVLLGISWVTRTIEGGGPPVYELVIESGPLNPEDENFEQVAYMVKADTAELLAESVSIESIDHYSTVLTIRGDDGQVTGQMTTAEFQTSAGRVELVASLNVITNRPIEFSRPMK